MGGQGSKGLPTAGIVGSSPSVGHRKIRGHNRGGDDEDICSEVTGGALKKI
jgi:hypothetical protein